MAPGSAQRPASVRSGRLQTEMRMMRIEKALSIGTTQAVNAATMRRSAGNLPKILTTCAREGHFDRGLASDCPSGERVKGGGRKE